MQETVDNTDCIDCNIKILPISFNLSREQWLLIHPSDGGILCPNCIIKRASKLPNVINITGKITFAEDYNHEHTTRKS